MKKKVTHYFFCALIMIGAFTAGRIFARVHDFNNAINETYVSAHVESLHNLAGVIRAERLDAVLSVEVAVTEDGNVYVNTEDGIYLFEQTGMLSDYEAYYEYTGECSHE